MHAAHHSCRQRRSRANPGCRARASQTAGGGRDSVGSCIRCCAPAGRLHQLATAPGRGEGRGTPKHVHTPRRRCPSHLQQRHEVGQRLLDAELAQRGRVGGGVTLSRHRLALWGTSSAGRGGLSRRSGAAGWVDRGAAAGTPSTHTPWPSCTAAALPEPASHPGASRKSGAAQGGGKQGRQGGPALQAQGRPSTFTPPASAAPRSPPQTPAALPSPRPAAT